MIRVAVLVLILIGIVAPLSNKLIMALEYEWILLLNCSRCKAGGNLLREGAEEIEFDQEEGDPNVDASSRYTCHP